MTVRDVRERFAETLLGKRLRSADITHQTAPNFIALAVLASDALSSCAYATEELLIILNTAAIGGFTLFGFHGEAISIPIAIAISHLDCHCDDFVSPDDFLQSGGRWWLSGRQRELGRGTGAGHGRGAADGLHLDRCGEHRGRCRQRHQRVSRL